MAAKQRELEQALFQWVNTFELDKKISSWKDLEDGRLLWEVLGQIDGDFFSGRLPENEKKPSENWIPRWQNLKHIERAVTTYIREECSKLPFLSKEVSIDLKSIAINAAAEEASSLLKWVLLAAFYSPKSNAKQVQIMAGLGPKVMHPVATAVTEMEAEDSRLAQLLAEQEKVAEEPALDGESRKASAGRDIELEFEEKLIHASSENRKLHDHVADLSAQLQERYKKVSELQEQLAESRLALDGRGRKFDESEAQQLRDDANRDRDYIASLEADYGNASSKIESLERQISKLHQDSTTKQDLRDELQLLKAERKELANRANANENLKKKIQSLQDQEKVNQDLQVELQVAREQVQELDKLRERTLALKKAHDESSETIANGEQEIFDQKTARKRLEHELQALTARYQQAQDLFNREQDNSAELQARIRELEVSHVPRGSGLGSLEDELADSDRIDEPAMSAQKASPTEDTAVTADTLVLRQKIDVLQARCSKMEAQYMEALEENLGLQSSVGGVDGLDADSPFVKQKTKLQAAESELAQLRRQMFDSDKKKADLTHRLTSAEALLKSQTSEDQEHIRKTIADELKGLNDNHSALVSRYEDLQEHCKELEEEVNEQKSLTRFAMFSRNSFDRDSEDELSSAMTKMIRQQLEEVRAATAAQSRKLMEDTSSGMANMVSTAKRSLNTKQQQLQEHEQTIQKLRRELEKAEKGVGQAGKNSTMQQEITSLKRENKLMASAFYDIQTRLQTNHVVLQRRAEPPRSWIMKQRQAVSSGGSNQVRR